MSAYKELLISPKELKASSSIEKKIIIKKSKDILLTGKVLDDYNKPIVKAIISIKQVNNICYPPIIKDYGYITTNINGEFAVLLPISCELDYVLDLYQPIIKC